jgi:hypothetical protein
VLLLGGHFAACNAETPQEKRAEIRKMRAEALAKLYKVHPAARALCTTTAAAGTST